MIITPIESNQTNHTPYNIGKRFDRFGSMPKIRHKFSTESLNRITFQARIVRSNHIQKASKGFALYRFFT